MTRKIRVSALLLTALLLFVLLASAALIVLHADHDCAGEDCRVCELLGLCVRQLRLAVIAAAAAVTVPGAARLTRKAARGVLLRLPSATPVALKVKLSN